MSLLQRFEAWIESNKWRFFKAVHTTNWDLPYHDLLIINNTEGQETISGSYPVGKNNRDAHGNQAKLFVSKHTFVFVVGETDEIRWNDSKNVIIALPATSYGPFKTNIHTVFYSVAVGSVLAIYFEGVLPQEARNPE